MLLKKSNRFRESEAELRSALRLREGLAREASGDADAPQAVAESRYHLGALLARLRDRGPEDERSYRAALDIQRGMVGERGVGPSCGATWRATSTTSDSCWPTTAATPRRRPPSARPPPSRRSSRGPIRAWPAIGGSGRGPSTTSACGSRRPSGPTRPRRP